MSFVIVCPHCSAKLRGDPSLVGQEVECQRCHENFCVEGNGSRPSEAPARTRVEPSRTRRPRGDSPRPLFVKPPPPALNPWLLLALLLGGSVALGTAVLFGVSALIPSPPAVALGNPGAASQTRSGDGGSRNDAPPRLPLRSQELPSQSAGSPPPDATPPAADKSSDEGLSVVSTPPETVRKGETLRYQIRARSLNGGVRYRLTSGPPEMRVLPDGEVVWRVPNVARPEQKVSVLVTDVDGNRVAHRFTLKVVGAGSKD